MPEVQIGHGIVILPPATIASSPCILHGPKNGFDGMTGQYCDTHPVSGFLVATGDALVSEPCLTSLGFALQRFEPVGRWGWGGYGHSLRVGYGRHT
jgi:hypothetical protein